MAAGRIPIGVQLYSVRDECEKDMLGTIAKVAKMGYEGVEFAGYFGHSAKDLKKCLDDNGIVACGTHTPWHMVSDENLNETIDFHHEIGCPFAIVPWIPKELRDTPEHCKSTGEHLAKVCEKLRKVNLWTGFHVHGDDILPLSDGKDAYHHLGEQTPYDFIMQYDTANAYMAGGDPVQPIIDFPGRNLSVHIKDWEKPGGGPAIVGEGGIPMAEVFAACENGGGTRWYVVEHEDDDNPSLVAIEKCLQNMKAMGK